MRTGLIIGAVGLLVLEMLFPSASCTIISFISAKVKAVLALIFSTKKSALP